jgi:hypothetical protein
MIGPQVRGAVVLLAPWIIALEPASTSAQVNIERFRRGDTPPGMSGFVGMDLSARTGNVEIVEFEPNGAVTYTGARLTTMLIGSANFGWQGRESFSNEALLHVRQVFRTQAQLRPEVFAQIDYDKARLLTFRGLLGAGIRVRLYQADVNQFWLGSSYMFEYENLRLPDTAVHPDQTSVHRWSNYISMVIGIGDRSRITSAVYVQPQVDAPKDVRLLSQSTLAVGISGQFSLVVSFDMRYDSRPPTDIRPFDTRLRTGASVGF